jgi:hypothetical protein
MLKRSTSHKEKGTPTQTRVDTGSWTVMSKIFKTAIGKAWAKKKHTEGILCVEVDNPYFVMACRET